MRWAKWLAIGAGHGVFGVPVASDDPKLAKLGDLGGTPAGNNAARHDSWPKLLAFLAGALQNPK